MRIRIVLITFVFGLLSSCSSIPVQEDNLVINHVISIDRDGKLNEIPLAKPINSMKKVSHKQAKAHFDHILDGISSFPMNANREIEVLLYIHGGLNSKVESMQRAVRNYRCITNDQEEAKYPVFINWETGPLQTYKDHLVRIRQGETSKFAPYTSPVYLLTDVANSVVNAPKSWLVNGEHSWRSTFFRHRKGVDRYLEDFKSGDNQVLYVGNGADDTFVRRAQWLATSPAKLVTTPFTYTLAKPAWDVMLRRTNTLFFTDDAYKKTKKVAPIETRNNSGKGALLQFLYQLNDMIKKRKLKVKITLVGHSMGAIVVNRMLAMDKLDLPYKNIVHMGSADSIRNLMSTVVPYLDKKKNDNEVRFFSLSLHPENEDREANFLGTVPSGSLLVWIDNMYTTPETVIDKRSGRWVNMHRVLPTVPKDVRKKMYFKIFGLHSGSVNNETCEPAAKKLTQALQHGDFDDLEYWREGTWWR